MINITIDSSIREKARLRKEWVSDDALLQALTRELELLLDIKIVID